MQSKSVQQSGFVRRLMGTPVLDSEHEAELMRAWQEDGCVRSRNRIFEAYSRLCVTWASKYRSSAFSHEDLVQEGMIGLASAIDRYDSAKGASFGYFAGFRIRAAIQSYMVQHMSTVTYKRSGRHKALAFSLRRFIADCQAKARAERRDATAHDILTEAALAFGVPVADVERLSVMLAHKDQYLSDPINEGGATLGDTIPDDRTPDLDKLLDQRFSDAEVSCGLEEALQALPERMRDIVKRRWLSPDGRPPRLDDLAAEHGVSRERIRQIEAEGLKRLKILMKRYASAEDQALLDNGFDFGGWTRSVKHPRASSRRTPREAALKAA